MKEVREQAMWFSTGRDFQAEEAACGKILRCECALNICETVRRLLWLEWNEQGEEGREGQRSNVKVRRDRASRICKLF